MGTQISIFDGANKYVNDKPIRLIECFAGYGSQALALKYLGIPFEHHRIAEWAVKSIQAYKDMHFPDDNADYSCGLTFDNVIDYLFERGISADYNKPMTREQIKRMGENKCRTVYNNIKATHNLVSVCNVKAKDLEIIDTDRFTYLLTYSFPCQDLSSAGLSKGMAKGSGTRSGLLWEVERILKECDELPQVLLMENVPEVIGQKNKDSFADWIAFLDSMGYKSKWEILNGTDFEIPQNRERCFMVSVIGDYFFDFPRPVVLGKTVENLLDSDVDDRYYCSPKKINYILNRPKSFECKINAEISNTIRTNYSNGNANECYIKDEKGYRSFTEKEVFRLMGVKDEDYERVARNQSKSSLYHLAGDSIVVNVLMAIFKELFM